MSEAEEAAEVRALVAGHGDFAAGIVSAVGQITGRAEAFLTLSNRDMSAADEADILAAWGCTASQLRS